MFIYRSHSVTSSVVTESRVRLQRFGSPQQSRIAGITPTRQIFTFTARSWSLLSYSMAVSPLKASNVRSSRIYRQEESNEAGK